MYSFPYTILNMNDFHLLEPIDFDWDENNEQKIFKKHGLNRTEIEEIFYNYKLAIPDEAHSVHEIRYGLYGETNIGKILFAIFTIRDRRVRVISTRLANKKERLIYEKIKEDSKI